MNLVQHPELHEAAFLDLGKSSPEGWAERGGGLAGDGGTYDDGGGQSIQQQHTSLQGLLSAVPVLTSAEFAASIAGFGDGDGDADGGAGDGGFGGFGDGGDGGGGLGGG